MYAKNFGEFFNDQISNAYTVILSRTDVATEEKIKEALDVIRGINANAVVVTTPVSKLSDEELIKAYEGFDTKLLDADQIKEAMGHDEDECDDPNCSCHHHHHHDHEECECHHHHDEDDDDEDEEEHHHHHDHDHEECECHHHHDEDEEEHHHHHHDEEECDDPNCSCHHHHHHHHGHDADEVFQSIGIETVKKYDIESFKAIINDMANGKYGVIVRAKGIIEATDNKWYLFQLTPEEVSFEETHSIPMAKIVVIGSKIIEEDIKKLF